MRGCQYPATGNGGVLPIGGVCLPSLSRSVWERMSWAIRAGRGVTWCGATCYVCRQPSRYTCAEPPCRRMLNEIGIFLLSCMGILLLMPPSERLLGLDALLIALVGLVQLLYLLCLEAAVGTLQTLEQIARGSWLE